VTYEPLHHKYRPQTFADLVGQEAIATTLTHAIELQRIAPAYLFTGPRGTGKTSSARILAKSLNCIQGNVPTASPCGQCAVCQAIIQGNALDVIEIDAASNTGVDNIRELIERAQFAPVQCRYKIYCLDEVHMLSAAAFNALLKTLEEPPDRVVFILATTDPQRVLPTIISRCQRFDFRRIPLPSMVAHLKEIAEKETIAIAPDAIQLVAQISQGGLRDAESLLDQLSLLVGEVTVERVWDLVGSVPEQDLLKLLDAIATGNPEHILETVRHLLDRGREPLIVLQSLSGFFRDLLIAKTAPHRQELVALTEPTWKALGEASKNWELSRILQAQQHLRSCEGQIKNSTQPRLWLEVSILELLSLTLAPSTSVPASPTIPVASQANVSQSPPPQIIVPQSPAPAPTSTPLVTTAALNGQTVVSSPPASLPAESLSSQTTALPPEVPLVESPAPPLPTPVSTASEPTRAITSESTPTQPSDPVSVASMEAEEGDLNQTWQLLLEHLHRPSRALLKEHAQLTAFRGREAKIGIRNKNLAKIAQSKLPDVEEAFQKVFNRKVAVSVHILAATKTPIPEGAIASEPIPAAETVVPPVVANSPPLPIYSPPAPPPIPTPTAFPTAPPAPAPDNLVPFDASSPLAATEWETVDELTQASRSFAQFFNGAVVQLEGSSVVGTESITPPLEGDEASDWDDP
jgi:DNA polymerase III subunit gamma/tau